jgi:hypothetical protein
MQTAIDTPMTTAPADGFASPGMPQRVMVRAYRSFESGTRAVDRLVREEGIPRERVTLVARGLKWVQRGDASSAMIAGAKAGTIAGAACGLALYLLGLIDPGFGALIPVVAAAAVGAAAGLAIGGVAHRRAAERPDGAGRLGVEHFDVLVDEELAPVARKALTR